MDLRLPSQPQDVGWTNQEIVMAENWASLKLPRYRVDKTATHQSMNQYANWQRISFARGRVRRVYIHNELAASRDQANMAPTVDEPAVIRAGPVERFSSGIRSYSIKKYGFGFTYDWFRLHSIWNRFHCKSESGFSYSNAPLDSSTCSRYFRVVELLQTSGSS